MFEYGCTLPHLPSYLEIREDHKLIKQKSGEIPGVRYCHPLMKKLDTTNFDFKNVSTKNISEFPDGTVLLSRCARPEYSLSGCNKLC